MKSEAVLAAFRAFLQGQNDDATSYIRQIIAGERSSGRVMIASRLERMLSGRPQMIQLPSAPPSVQCIQPRKRLDDLILPGAAKAEVLKFIREWKGAATLTAAGLAPRCAALLRGPSGNGKTALAEAVAAEAGLPLGMVNYGSLIDSHLGETGKNLSKLFDFVAKSRCVLFLDEADSLLTSRSFGSGGSAAQENNRNVNQVLVGLDQVGRLATCPIMFASNFSGELDPALIRRIALDLELPAPSNGDFEAMGRLLERRWPVIAGTGWLEKARGAECFAAIEAAAESAAREVVLAQAEEELFAGASAQAAPARQAWEGEVANV